jgi:hypothetical protein
MSEYNEKRPSLTARIAMIAPSQKKDTFDVQLEDNFNTIIWVNPKKGYVPLKVGDVIAAYTNNYGEGYSLYKVSSPEEVMKYYSGVLYNLPPDANKNLQPQMNPPKITSGASAGNPPVVTTDQGSEDKRILIDDVGAGRVYTPQHFTIQDKSQYWNAKFWVEMDKSVERSNDIKESVYFKGFIEAGLIALEKGLPLYVNEDGEVVLARTASEVVEWAYGAAIQLLKVANE